MACMAGGDARATVRESLVVTYWRKLVWGALNEVVWATVAAGVFHIGLGDWRWWAGLCTVSISFVLGFKQAKS